MLGSGQSSPAKSTRSYVDQCGNFWPVRKLEANNKAGRNRGGTVLDAKQRRAKKARKGSVEQLNHETGWIIKEGEGK